MQGKRVVLSAVTLVAVLFVASDRSAGAENAHRATPTDTVRVRVFELVDGRGQVRARMNVESSGEVVLRLMDPDGIIRVKLGAAKDGSGMVLLNDRTEPGVHILAKADGSSLRLVNKDGRERLVAP